MEKKKYSVIYADPPWQFKAYSPKGMGDALPRLLGFPAVFLDVGEDHLMDAGGQSTA